MKIWFGLQINGDGNPVIVSASTDKEQARKDINQEIGSRHMLQPVDIFLDESEDQEIAENDSLDTVQ